MIYTLLTNFVKVKASSNAVSPPPTTATILFLKKKPSQVAQAETPFPRRRCSEGKLSHRAFAPVAIIMDFVFKDCPWTRTVLIGLEKSTFDTFSSTILDP